MVPASAQPAIRRAGSRDAPTDEWHPSLKRRPDDPTDPMTVDPTLRLDLLAKVQGVSLEGGSRNVFQFSTPPPPPAPKGPGAQDRAQDPGADRAGGPGQTARRAPVKPPPPPINLKYYGYSTVKTDGHKTAFFLDGEDILVAGGGRDPQAAV